MRLLLVENHRVFAETVVRQFLSAHQVAVVGSLAVARAAVEFDAALVDFDLDDGKGDVFVAELRARGFGGRVIAISSHAEGNAALMRVGADAVCSKLEFAKIGEVLEGPRIASHSLVVASGAQAEDVAETFRAGAQLIAVVADGAGGTSHGLEAARAVADAVRSASSSSPPLEAGVWKELLERLAITLAAHDAGRTTAIVAATDGVRVVGASVGDSEAWLIGVRGVHVLTERQSRKPLLGETAAVVTPFDVLLGHDTLLIASDGLFKYAARDAIQAGAAATRPLPALCPTTSASCSCGLDAMPTGRTPAVRNSVERSSAEARQHPIMGQQRLEHEHSV